MRGLLMKDTSQQNAFVLTARALAFLQKPNSAKTTENDHKPAENRSETDFEGQKLPETTNEKDEGSDA